MRPKPVFKEDGSIEKVKSVLYEELQDALQDGLARAQDRLQKECPENDFVALPPYIDLSLHEMKRNSNDELSSVLVVRLGTIKFKPTDI